MFVRKIETLVVGHTTAGDNCSVAVKETVGTHGRCGTLDSPHGEHWKILNYYWRQAAGQQGADEKQWGTEGDEQC